jgi:diguanylate cyclase (GGDEF)-like protein
MDPFTLVVACALAAAIMAVSMGMLYLAGTRQRCLLDWSAAGACFAVSSLIAAFSFKMGGRHLLLSSIGNSFYILGHFGILAGLRRQLGLAVGWKWMVAAGALVAGVHTLPFVQDSMLNRLCLFTPVVVAINLTAARLLWRHPDREARIACMPLIVLELFFSLELVLRTLYALFGAQLPAALVNRQVLETSGSLFVLVFLSVATMSCAQVVMHQQALALRRASMTDVLTGWLNRRALIDIAAREFARCRRGGKSLYVLVFDIDHFKAVNDRHGHAVGDEALSHVTALAAGVLRGCDALFRTGGEEFAVLLDAADPMQARAVAERLREQIDSHPLRTSGCVVPMTVSVGVAAMDPVDATWEDMLGRADNALYHAKQHGRNRVSVASGAGTMCAQAVA